MRIPAGSRNGNAGPTRQRGIGLLVILVVAGVLAVMMVGNVIVGQRGDQARSEATRVALAQAKEALITYAIGRTEDDYNHVLDQPGHLPCPELDHVPTVSFPEGSSAGNCGDANETSVGRLPWWTLGISPPRDGTGECLWFAVSGRFKNHPRGGEIFNWDTEGQIKVLRADGSVMADKVAAVIIAPGAARDQTRPVATGALMCPGSHAPADYLEADHGASNHAMSTGLATTVMIDGGIDPGTGRETVNDRIAIITTDELFAAVQRRKDFGVRSKANVPGSDNGHLRLLTYRVATCLANYQYGIDLSRAPGTQTNDRRMPWAGGRQQTVNPVTNYALDAETLSTTDLLAGRAPSANPAPDASFGEPLGKYFQHAQGGCNNLQRAWWDQWRDHLYYAVSPDFAPTASATDTHCASSCLRVNGSDPIYAAVVIFAGRRLPSQSRPQWSIDTTTPLPVRETYANYLEGINLTNIAAAPTATSPPNPAGTGYTYRSDVELNTTQDDFAYCIRVAAAGAVPTVSPCPPLSP